jgi:V-type H+-transporting ATPase subunit a
MQFEDMNARDMHRPYKKYVQRIDEMERLLRFLTDEVERIPNVEIVKDNVEDFLVHAEDYKLEDVEARLKRYYADFVQFKENNMHLIAKRNAALEERYVVQTAAAHIGQLSSTRSACACRRHGSV